MEKKDNYGSQGSSKHSSQESSGSKKEKYPPGGGTVYGIPADRFDKITSAIRKPRIQQQGQQQGKK